jgi:hypothetical protein
MIQEACERSSMKFKGNFENIDSINSWERGAEEPSFQVRKGWVGEGKLWDVSHLQ